MTERVWHLIDAITAEPFDAGMMWAEAAEAARRKLLAEGKATWPNGRSLFDGHPHPWPFRWTPPGEHYICVYDE